MTSTRNGWLVKIIVIIALTSCVSGISWAWSKINDHGERIARVEQALVDMSKDVHDIKQILEKWR